MKILFCTPVFGDYGLDSLYDGLCQVLGQENVLDYPSKPSLHGQTPGKLAWYPSLFDYPETVSNLQKLEMLRCNEFDIILIGCRANLNFTDDQNMLELLKEKSQIIPTYLIDQGDEPGINTKMMDNFNTVSYFKREYFRNKISDPKIIPLSFSYSSKYLPGDISGERSHTLFWAGKVIPSRQPYITICQALRGKPFYGFPQDRYRLHLAQHTIGLNLKGVGNDTVRYYEIPANGTLLFTEKPDFVIENGFTDGETAVMFESPEEMKEKLDYCLKNRDYVDKIRLAGYDWFQMYHTTKIRAGQLLNKISKL